MKITSIVAALAGLSMLSMLAGRVVAAQMFRFDLESLAYMSTAVIEGNVTAAQRVHWVDWLTVKITHVYAGDFKKGQMVIAWLSAHAKAGADPFTTGQ